MRLIRNLALLLAGMLVLAGCKGILCVQFHPELLYARGGNTTVLSIFEDLVARSR